jgi:ATP-binding cassette, subfamily B, bacterial HlyB/CyaB
LDQRSNPTSRPQGAPAERIDSGLQSLALIAGYYHIAAEPVQLAHDLGLAQRAANSGDLVRAAQRLGLKARILKDPPAKRLGGVPLPAILSMKDGRPPSSTSMRLVVWLSA